MILGLRRPWSALILTAACLAVLSVLHLTIVPTAYHESADVQWTQFAYVQYVTDEHYLCNSLMMLEALQRYGAKAERVVMYPVTWDDQVGEDIRTSLLKEARDTYGAKMVPVGILSIVGKDVEQTWVQSYTKLLAFTQTQYKRVVVLDSDATLRDVSKSVLILTLTDMPQPRTWTNYSTYRQHV